MATPLALSLAQQVFSILSDQTGGDGQFNLQALLSQAGSNCTNMNATSTPTSSPANTMPTTFDLSSILTFLFSFSSASDWIKFAVLGTVLTAARGWLMEAYYRFYNSFFINAHFENCDEVYNWMMVWLAKNPKWTQTNDVHISTKSFGLSYDSVGIEGEEIDDIADTDATRPLTFEPSFSHVFRFWYKGRWMSVSRSYKEPDSPYGSRTEALDLCIWSWNRTILSTMLLEAKKAYKDGQEDFVSVYASDFDSWQHMTSRPKRPLKSIVLEPGVKELLMRDARDFLRSKRWYSARGIPFRRGYLLYGAPGTGKTSIIHGIAGELGLDVYILSLSRIGMDDNTLARLISSLPERCIALMEDIDAAFSRTLNRDSDEEERESNPSSQNGMSSTPTSRISLSGLLNALDGVGAQEGRILFATTNKYTSLDPALCRPGRMDIHVEFRLASRYQANELFRCFYLPDSEKGTDDEKETDSAEIDSTADSGYLSSPEVEDEKAELIKLDAEKTEDVEPNGLPVNIPHYEHGPKLSFRQLETLAGKFAAAIPEREFSMAALQGYLMGYKTQPFEAVADARIWVKKQRLDAAARAEKEKEKKAKAQEKKVEKTVAGAEASTPAAEKEAAAT
ncbi:P-loop containing nucleoside triphosphate hydrolase protein [Coprinopsis marcescibilis]|uniref:P-loop containing nucleoside triphosphate hydrolase protein n=1 Tax=Coprinopsis marcescibilis TaxID=230819 RepID=A0A5C3L9B8_COPMA|nr:P-loop containing nucleoside triphosphate hydrolase protein [Coprinopsis marcescibilis]